MATQQLARLEEIANDLVEKCRQQRFMEAIEAYYDDNIASIESMEMPQGGRELRGKQAIIEKCKAWESMNEVHSIQASEPMIGKNQFAVHFKLDVTCKQRNERMEMTEMALYDVSPETGRIVREEFFYRTGE